MTITPAGSTTWEREASADIYGGHADKEDYQGQGVVNPKTDISAAQFARLCADVAANSRTAPFSVVTLTCNDSSPAAPTVSYVNQMDVGISATSYAGDSPPSGFPTCTRVSDGKVQIAWPALPADDFGVTGALVIRHVTGNIINYPSGYSTLLIVQVDDTTWTFEAYDLSAVIPDVAMTVEVW